MKAVMPKETYEETRDRILRKHRCPRCFLPPGREHVALTEEEALELAGERGRIAAMPEKPEAR